MIRCIILDDEPLAVVLLKRYIEKTEGLALIAAGTKPDPVCREVPDADASDSR